MVIPNSVKIDGNMVVVDVDQDGSVMVGQSVAVMDHEVKERINQMPFDLHMIPWQEQMFNLYEDAYKQEKKRIMSQ